MNSNNYKTWSDSQFKTIFLGFLVVSTIPIVYLLSLTKDQASLHQQLLDTKQIYILDPTGQKYLVTALQSEAKKFEIFGKMLLKKMYGFDYRGSKDNLSFLREYMTAESYNSIIQMTSPLRAEVKETSGYYKVKITDYFIERDNYRYMMNIFYEHELVSKAVSKTKKYAAKLYLVRGSQTQDNYAGVFLEDFEIYEDESMQGLREELANIKQIQGE